jgi:hypothetical protein
MVHYHGDLTLVNADGAFSCAWQLLGGGEVRGSGGLKPDNLYSREVLCIKCYVNVVPDTFAKQL